MPAESGTNRLRHLPRGVALVLPALALMLPLAAAAHTHRATSTAQPHIVLASYRVRRSHGLSDLLQTGGVQTGTASWYGDARRGFLTASGAVFDPDAMTAASHTLPLGTRVLVTIAGTARSVLVTITDRMQCATRVIDLSMGAARQIGMLAQGTARVTLRRV